MKIVFISKNQMFLCRDGKVSALPCERAESYKQTVNEINKNKEWKHSGRGAEFMGAVEHYEDASKQIHILGAAADDNFLVYSAAFGGMGAIYRKDPDVPDAPEGHIYTGMNRRIGDISCKDGRIAAIMDEHLAIFDERGNYDELTDGASIESSPFWSANDGRLFCSTVGRDMSGSIGVSASSVLAVDLKAGTIEELFAEEGNDLLMPKNDAEGNFYFIRQPYKAPKPQKENILLSVLMFPIRLVTAIFGFINAFSVIFGGQPLRKNRGKSDVKTKSKSDRELYFEGRLLEAEKNEKENAESGDVNPGILPRNRVLVRVAPDGTQTVLKRGVLDYALCDEGVICSNGKELLLIGNDGEEKLISKAVLAEKINIINAAPHKAQQTL